MTQGDPLPPNIFNVVVDAVVRHCILLLAGGEVGQDRWGMEMRHHTDIFYAGDGMVSLKDPAWMQGRSKPWPGCSTDWDFK